MSRFAALGLAAPLPATLAELGYATPTPVQQQAIPAIVAGRDVLAAARTGTGKTAAFALPLLHALLGRARAAGRLPQALVLVPTRELAEQVHASFCRYGAGSGIDCALAFGGMAMKPQLAMLAAGCDVLVATPGRLLDLMHKAALDLSAVRALVLDEADRMLDLGFGRELATLAAALPAQRQTLLFSATFAAPVRQLAAGWLKKPLEIASDPPNSAAPKVKQWVVPVDKKRKGALLARLWQANGWRQALVFVRTRAGVDELAGWLAGRGLAVAALHGERSQPERLAALAAFHAGEVQVLVATDVAARGLDIAGLPLVVNFDLPTVAEDYIHRIGRTGRAGAAGTAVSLVSADEAPLLAAIEALLKRGLPREEEPGFEPRHEVPLTSGAAARVKLPPAKKPKLPAPARPPAKGPGAARPGRSAGQPGRPAKAGRSRPR